MNLRNSVFAIVVSLFGINGVHSAPDDDTACVAYLAYTDGYWQAWTMTPDGKNQKQLTRSHYEKSHISWYPNGKALLLNGNQGGLAKVDINTGIEEPIKVALNGMNDAVLSPDGKKIAFSLTTSGSRDDHNIWLVNADGSGARKLTNLKRMQHEPTWTPDMKWIYFTSNIDTQSHDIWRVSLDGKRKEQLTSGQLYSFDVEVADNGDIVFSSNRSGAYEIWLKKSGEKAIQLTRNAARDARPSWSSSYNSLIFESSRGGSLNIWRLNLGQKIPRQLTHHPVGARFPVWGGSPGCK